MVINKSKKIKHVAILFSSGLDSTYLLYKNLKEGNIVYPYYVDILNNTNKRIVEKQNIFMLYELFEKNFGEQINKPKIIGEFSINVEWGNDLLFVQLPIWIFGLSYIGVENLNEIQIGYVANDDAISYVEEIKMHYYANKWLHKNKRPKLTFPLIKNHKSQMMDDLPIEYKLFVSSCENPELKPYFYKIKDKRLQYYNPCGDCVACQRIIRDELSYNFLYHNMIKEHKEKINLGNKYFIFKDKFPNEYNKIENIVSEAQMMNYPKMEPINEYVDIDESKYAVGN